MVRAPDLKSADPEFKLRFDHQLDLFQVIPGSTPRLRLYTANWSTSCHLGFLFQSFVSLALKSPSGERSIKYSLHYIHFHLHNTALSPFKQLD